MTDTRELLKKVRRIQIRTSRLQETGIEAGPTEGPRSLDYFLDRQATVGYLAAGLDADGVRHSLKKEMDA